MNLVLSKTVYKYSTKLVFKFCFSSNLSDILHAHKHVCRYLFIYIYIYIYNVTKINEELTFSFYFLFTKMVGDMSTFNILDYPLLSG